jgi:leader peptidase (prepilin peptidase)/N-methyltransferase
VVERSHCPKCGHQLSAWYENIPLLSFLALGGKCRGCKAPISMAVPAGGTADRLLFALVVWRFGLGWKAG